MNKMSIIGVGNMGGSILKGILENNLYAREDIEIYHPKRERLENLEKKYHVSGTTSIEELAKNASVILLAVKPQVMSEVADELKKFYSKNQLIISIAAGITIDFLEKNLGKDAKIVRVMPNTPLLVGEGVSTISLNKNVEREELAFVKGIFSTLGMVEIVDEKLIDAAIGVCGSSPAYVYMFIEAMADGAVCCGMKRDLAYKMAAQSVLGASKMVLETNIHPAKLKDMVCSPKGTTIEAVRSLEKNNFRSSVMEAVISACKKSEEMSRENN